MTLSAILFVALAAADDSAPEALMTRLASERYAEREEAARALEALGERALPALRAALQGDDPEVRRRARDLVRRIEQRREADRLRVPTRVRVSARGQPLEAVAAELGRLGGVTLKVSGEAARKPITWESGDLTFWEALDRLCAAAGVAEEPPTPGGPSQDENVSTTSVMMIGRRGTSSPTDVMRPRDEPRLELVLKAGKAAPTPTHLGGALRVRAAVPGTVLPGQPRLPGDLLVVLDVAAEGPVVWHRASGVRIDAALDENGRALALRPASYRPPVSSRSGIIVNGVPLDPEPDETSPAGRLVPVRLRPREGAPERLQELRGAVIGQVRTRTEELVTVDRILEATGRTVKGPRVGSVRVVEAEPEVGGGTHLRVMVDAAPRGLNAHQAPTFSGRIFVNGRSISPENSDLLCSSNFVLLDTKGRPHRITGAVCTGRSDGPAREYELSFEPERGAGPPAKFVYRDQRTVFLEVPFVLRDVALSRP